MFGVYDNLHSPTITEQQNNTHQTPWYTQLVKKAYGIVHCSCNQNRVCYHIVQVSWKTATLQDKRSLFKEPPPPTHTQNPQQTHIAIIFVICPINQDWKP